MAYTQQEIAALREEAEQAGLAADPDIAGLTAQQFSALAGGASTAGSRSLHNDHAPSVDEPVDDAGGISNAHNTKRDQGNEARRSQAADATFAAYSTGIARYNNFTIEIGGEEMDAEEFENEITDILDDWDAHRQTLQEQGYTEEEIGEIRDKLERAKDMLADRDLSPEELNFLDSFDSKILDILFSEATTESSDNDADAERDLVTNNSNSISRDTPSDNRGASSKESLNEGKHILADGHLTENEEEFAQSSDSAILNKRADTTNTNSANNDAGVQSNSFANGSRLIAEKQSPDTPETSGNNYMDDIKGSPFPTAPDFAKEFARAVNNETREPQNAKTQEVAPDTKAENSTAAPASSPGDLGLA